MMDRQLQQAWNFVQLDLDEDVKKLVPTQVNPNSSTYSTENQLHTLLMCAAAHGASKCTAYLISVGADVSKRNFTGYSALHWAAFSGRTECVDLLLKAGASLELQTEDGRTPLHVAASRGHLQFIKYIAERGADLNAVTSDGWTAMHYALIGNHKPVVQYFLEKKIDYNGLDVNMKTIDSIAEEYKRTWFSTLVSQS